MKLRQVNKKKKKISYAPSVEIQWIELLNYNSVFRIRITSYIVIFDTYTNEENKYYIK